MLNQTRKSLSTEVSRAAGEAFDAGTHALESTRQLASQAMEKSGERVRDLGNGARDLACKSAYTLSDATTTAQRQLGHYARATRRYVSKQPVKSALIAAAVGAAVAALMLAVRRSGQDH